MRVIVVSSEVLSQTKLAVIDGLGQRLAGIAALPIVPYQVNFWRHIRSLALYSGPWGWPRLAVGAVAGRLMRVCGPIVHPKRVWKLDEIARRAGVPFLRARHILEPLVAKWLSDLSPDLVVSLQSHYIPEALLAIPVSGWLNLHHGRLPNYRGVFSVFWAMLHREPALYVTAHTMSRYFDRGPVVVERAIPVIPGATVEAMENRMWRESPGVLLEAVRRIESGEPFDRGAPDGGRHFTYPTRADLRRAASEGLRLR